MEKIQNNYGERMGDKTVLLEPEMKINIKTIMVIALIGVSFVIVFVLLVTGGFQRDLFDISSPEQKAQWYTTLNGTNDSPRCVTGDTFILGSLTSCSTPLR